MLRNRVLTAFGGCFLAASAAWADDGGYIDCSNHPEATEVFAKARKTRELVASLPCGERFTVIQYGFIFSRIQTADGKVGYVYSNLITAGAPPASGQQPVAKPATPPPDAPTASTAPANAAPMLPQGVRGATISSGSAVSTTAAQPPTAAAQAPPISAPVTPPTSGAPTPANVATTATTGVQPNSSAAPQPQPAAQSPAPTPAPTSDVPKTSVTGSLPTPTILVEPQSAQDKPAAQTPTATAKTPEVPAPTAQPTSAGPSQPQPAAAGPPAPAPMPTRNPPETPASAEQPATPARTDADSAPAQPATPVVRNANTTSSWEKPNPGGGHHAPLIELFGGYSFARLNNVSGAISNLNGALGSVGWNVKPWLQLVADTSYNYVTASGTKIVLYGNHWGPRIFLRRQSRWGVTPFAEGLFGGSRADTTVTGSPTTSENVFSFKVGGGLDFKPSRHFEIRVLDIDYYRTAFGGAHQGNYWASTGIVLRLFGGNSE